MNYYDQFAEWLFSPETSPMQKAALIITIVAASVLLNDVFGFTFYYNTQRKVTQISQLTALIKDPATDARSREQAVILREKIFHREPWLSAFFERLNLSGNFPSSQDMYHKKNAPSSKDAILSSCSIRNDLVYVISTAGIYLIFLLQTFFTAIFTTKSYRGKDPVSSYFVFSLPFLIVAISCYAFLGFISRIFSIEKWNYLLNMVIQIVSLVLMMKAIRRAQKQKRR